MVPPLLTSVLATPAVHCGYRVDGTARHSSAFSRATTKSSSLFPWQVPTQKGFTEALHTHVAAAACPCVGAKAALARGTLEVLAARNIASAWDDVRIHDRLLGFAAEYRREPSLFRSFAVVFDGPQDLTEKQFEEQLWSRIQSLSDKDIWRGQFYDARASNDPGDSHFSLSFGGEAFFVVGLHPRRAVPRAVFPSRSWFSTFTTSSRPTR